MYYVIDRFEEETAVLVGDDRIILRLPAAMLPEGAREGDVLTCSDGLYAVDEAETLRRSDKMKSRLRALFKD